jgi:hypothetical protein
VTFLGVGLAHVEIHVKMPLLTPWLPPLPRTARSMGAGEQSSMTRHGVGVDPTNADTTFTKSGTQDIEALPTAAYPRPAQLRQNVYWRRIIAACTVALVYALWSLCIRDMDVSGWDSSEPDITISPVTSLHKPTRRLTQHQIERTFLYVNTLS